MLFVDDMAEPRETPEHPLKQLKVSALYGRQGVLAGRSATFSAAQLLSSNTETQCLRAEGPLTFTAGQCSSEMPPLKRSQVAGLGEWL